MSGRKLSNARRELPDLELSCLRILWTGGDQTVHGVRERLLPSRPLAYTTIMTVLDRLARKGAVSRRKVGRAHLYHAEFPREAALEHALEKLVEVYFDGSRAALISFLDGEPLATQPIRTPASFDESLL